MESQIKETAGSCLTGSVYRKQLKGIMGEIIPIYASMFSKHYIALRRSNIRHKSDLHFNKEEFLSSLVLYYPTPVHSGRKWSQMLADELMKPSILPWKSLVVNGARGKHLKYELLEIHPQTVSLPCLWVANSQSLKQSKSKTTEVEYFSKVPFLFRHNQI